MKSWLLDGLRYDLLSNLQWLESCHRFLEPLRAEAILRHMATSQRLWLSRCLSEEEAPPLIEDTEATLRSLNHAWIELIETADPTAYVSYQTTEGEQYYNMLEELALHVINHGSYHRGHLRGLAESQGLEDFPETDLILYFRRGQSV